jgi:hypothetical protein
MNDPFPVPACANVSRFRCRTLDTDGVRLDQPSTLTETTHSLLVPAGAAVSLAFAVWAHSTLSISGMALLVTGTFNAYALDHLIDLNGGVGIKIRALILAAMIVSTAVAFWLASTSLFLFGTCALFGGLALSYSWLKTRFPKMLLTTSAWTGALAFFPIAGLSEHAAGNFPILALTSAAAIVAANSLLCDIPDFNQDRSAGVRGIVPTYGPTAGASFACGIAILGAALGVVAGSTGLTLCAVSLAALALAVFRLAHIPGVKQLADLLVCAIPGPVTLILSLAGR